MGFKVLGPRQAASANFPVLLNQELTIHTPDGLALSSGKRGESGTGTCLMTEAEFQSLHPYPEASDKPWVSLSTDVWLFPPCCSRSQAKIHQISLEATEILSVLFFFKAQQTWIRVEMDSSSPGTLTL